MNIDSNDFDKKFNNIVKKAMPAKIDKALYLAGMAMMRDCFFVSPTVPIKEGWLRGSGSIHVNGIFRKESDTGKPGLANKGDTGLNDKLNTMTIGFNTPYASYVHEGIRKTGDNKIKNWSEPSSGAKFLESKLSMFKKQYVSLMARVIKGDK